MIETTDDRGLWVSSALPALQGHAPAYTAFQVELGGLGAQDPVHRIVFFRTLMTVLETRAQASNEPFTVRGNLSPAGTIQAFASTMDDEDGRRDRERLFKAISEALRTVVGGTPSFAGLTPSAFPVASGVELPRLPISPRAGRGGP